MKLFKCMLLLALLTTLLAALGAHAENLFVDCRPGPTGIKTSPPSVQLSPT